MYFLKYFTNIVIHGLQSLCSHSLIQSVHQPIGPLLCPGTVRVLNKPKDAEVPGRDAPSPKVHGFAD